MAKKTLDPARVSRRQEILSRITSSGEVPDSTEAVALAKEIETFEFAEGDSVLGNQRRILVQPMLTGGHVKLRAIVAKATQSLADLIAE